jgi:hypothetical protein
MLDGYELAEPARVQLGDLVEVALVDAVAAAVTWKPRRRALWP